jgi:hypothetical protein
MKNDNIKINGEWLSELPIWEKIQSLQVEYSIIRERNEAMHCLEINDEWNSKQILILNEDAGNIFITHSQNKDFYFVGFDTHGVMSSKGLMYANKSTGTCVTSISDRHLLIFDSKEMFLKLIGIINV